MVRGVVSGALFAVLLGAAPANAAVTAPRPVSPREFAVQQSAVATGGGRTAVLMAGYVGSGRGVANASRCRHGWATRPGSVRSSA